MILNTQCNAPDECCIDSSTKSQWNAADEYCIEITVDNTSMNPNYSKRM